MFIPTYLSRSRHGIYYFRWPIPKCLHPNRQIIHNQSVTTDERAAVRQARSRPLFEDLDAWLQIQLTRISGKTPLAMAIRYGLTRMKKLEPWLDHGITELDNNTAERAIRPLAVGRKNYLFVGSPSGGRSAAIAYTLIETVKLNGVDPQAWLTNFLANIAHTKISLLEDLMS
jgi:transposase